MTIDQLVARFADACQRYFGARFAEVGDWPDDLSLSNRISDELVTIMQEFKRRDALDRLLPFLDSDNITERSTAARAAITIAPERAIKTLEAVVASKDSYECFRAHRALEHYRRGETVVHGVG
jgi:HEAT repeat protein